MTKAENPRLSAVLARPTRASTLERLLESVREIGPGRRWEGAFIADYGKAKGETLRIRAQLHILGTQLEGVGHVTNRPVDRLMGTHGVVLSGTVVAGEVMLRLWFEACDIGRMPLVGSGALATHEGALHGYWTGGNCNTTARGCGGGGTFRLERVD
jgi:hypothetical protein